MPCRNCGKKARAKARSNTTATKTITEDEVVSKPGPTPEAKINKQAHNLFTMLSHGTTMATTLKTISGQCVIISGACPVTVKLDEMVEGVMDLFESAKEQMRLGLDE